MQKNITFRADSALIISARKRAQKQHTTLTCEFRRWLHQYAGCIDATLGYKTLMKRLSYACPTKKLSRDEMSA